MALEPLVMFDDVRSAELLEAGAVGRVGELCRVVGSWLAVGDDAQVDGVSGERGRPAVRCARGAMSDFAKKLLKRV